VHISLAYVHKFRCRLSSKAVHQTLHLHALAGEMARVAYFARAYLITLASALAPNRWDAPPHTSRELQRALGDCPTADAACALLQERAHDGNEVNVAATLVRAAREGASRKTLRYLYGACRASAGRMAPRQLANAARALRLADDDETAEREAALVAVCACVAMTPPADWTNAREVAICAELKFRAPHAIDAALSP